VSVDLTGGLSDDREYVFGAQPDDPEMRESVNAWIWDEGVDVGMPRIGVEAVADQWNTHDIQVNIGYGDGRVVEMVGPGKVHDPLGADGRPRILGAGPLSFELVEPFRHWRLHLDGMAVDSTVQEQIAGRASGKEPSVAVELHIDLRSAVPPWENGALLAEAARVLAEQEEGDLMGGPRFEQLARATGTLRVGDRTHEIRGGALRVRRQGIRRLPKFRGHAWQSALFPSGRGFGYIVYPPRDDGKPTYNEGYVFEGDGQLIPALVVQAPWLHSLEPSGEDVRVVLETEKGTTTIHGGTIVTRFSGMGDIPGAPVLQQAISRFNWDGETANGMTERSTLGEKIKRP
jgi:hypothetical protein